MRVQISPSPQLFIWREWSKVGSTGSYSVNRKVRFLLSQPIQPGYSLIGKTAGLYPILAADYREITGSSPVAPILIFILISIQKTILPEQTRAKKLRGQKNADNSLLLFATNTFVFCPPKHFFAVFAYQILFGIVLQKSFLAGNSNGRVSLC